MENTNYGYYSKVLNKPFDTLEELQAAEEKAAAEKEEKANKELARKNDADAVQKAFEVKVAAKKEFDTAVKKLSNEYQDEMAALDKKFRERYNELADKKSKADDAYDKVFAEFEKKHPEGYHLTLHNGDSRAEYYSKKSVNSSDMESAFRRWVNYWL